MDNIEKEWLCSLFSSQLVTIEPGSEIQELLDQIAVFQETTRLEGSREWTRLVLFGTLTRVLPMFLKNHDFVQCAGTAEVIQELTSDSVWAVLQDGGIISDSGWASSIPFSVISLLREAVRDLDMHPLDAASSMGTALFWMCHDATQDQVKEILREYLTIALDAFNVKSVDEGTLVS